jgi:hypothetical protein
VAAGIVALLLDSALSTVSLPVTGFKLKPNMSSPRRHVSVVFELKTFDAHRERRLLTDESSAQHLTEVARLELRAFR